MCCVWWATARRLLYRYMLTSASRRTLIARSRKRQFAVVVHMLSDRCRYILSTTGVIPLQLHQCLGNSLNLPPSTYHLLRKAVILNTCRLVRTFLQCESDNPHQHTHTNTPSSLTQSTAQNCTLPG